MKLSRHQFLYLAAGAAALPAVSRLARAQIGWTSGDGVFPLGNFALEAGTILPDARIAFKTHGRLNADGGNAILYPTQFAAQHGDIEWMIGPGRALDPDKYFVIVADQLGNGLSSSPSNTAAPFDRMRFPTVTIRDDVAAQHRLVTEELGVRRLALVVGYSMGAQQAYQWAVSHPDMVDRIAPVCGTARTSSHNAVFLEGVRAALIADAAWMDGEYNAPPSRGLRALARVYAGWGFSQDFYNNEIYRQLGFTSALDSGARFRVIPSLWGHMASAGINPPDSEFLSTEIKALLAA